MIAFRCLWRLVKIQRVLLAYGLDEFLPGRIGRVWRWIGILVGAKQRVALTRGERLRCALEELGPIYVKFGQALSTRPDLLPDDIAEELAKLQDRVPPFPGAQARRMIEAELGAKVTEVFAEFDEVPLASASIAQVHPAKLRDGSEVVVKVLRPGVEDKVRQDLALLAALARIATRLMPQVRRLRPSEVVAEFEKTLYDELDLMREAANAAQLRRNMQDLNEAANAAELRRHFEGSDLLYIPRVYWDWTRPRVLVLERIRGIPVSERRALEQAGVDLKLLAERGVEIFFTQVLRDNFFHADMHPGNVLVDPTRPARYLAVDFGQVASLAEEDQYYLAANLLAFFNRDYRKVARLHIESGWVPPTTRADEFEAAVRAVCEPIFAKPLGEISYGRLLWRLFQTARRFDMEVQPQLVLLQKTLLQIEGLGRQLYPELDLWQTAKPFLKAWFRQRTHPKALLSQAYSQLPLLAEELSTMPAWTIRALRQLKAGEFSLERHARELSGQLERNQRRTVCAIWGAALLLSGTWLLGQGWPLIAWLMAVIGGALLGRAWK